MNFQSAEHFTNLFKRSPKTLPTIPPDISQTSADCRAVSNVADIFRTFCRHSANCGCKFLNICRQVHRHVRRKIENSSAPYFLGDESEITAILAMFLASTIISSILQRVTKRMTRTWGICTRRAGKLYKARSRLYRSQLLQVNMRWKALAEIYTMHSFCTVL